MSGGVALVTGASSGIGAATAAALARRGYRVVVHGRDEQAVAEVAKAVGGVPASADLEWVGGGGGGWGARGSRGVLWCPGLSPRRSSGGGARRIRDGGRGRFRLRRSRRLWCGVWSGGRRRFMCRGGCGCRWLCRGWLRGL